MTYGPNASHFRGQMPRFLDGSAIVDLTFEPAPAGVIDEPVSEQRKSTWKTVAKMTSTLWPR